MFAHIYSTSLLLGSSRLLAILLVLMAAGLSGIYYHSDVAEPTADLIWATMYSLLAMFSAIVGMASIYNWYYQLPGALAPRQAVAFVVTAIAFAMASYKFTQRHKKF
ncbi:hypothetical protein [Salinibius halmophilus]|uniref:hypothetical protein n=1 Tax=Salinibius halmophilus TaxID=1853216 RepID=UPI000E66457C|nr:hypothetical protein [Salinibius halmophilus]